ncbi:unnamed protein product, partial [Ceratitis capitata]
LVYRIRFQPATCMLRPPITPPDHHPIAELWWHNKQLLYAVRYRQAVIPKLPLNHSAAESAAVAFNSYAQHNRVEVTW